jgi:hypothetical protein
MTKRPHELPRLGCRTVASEWRQTNDTIAVSLGLPPYSLASMRLPTGATGRVQLVRNHNHQPAPDRVARCQFVAVLTGRLPEHGLFFPAALATCVRTAFPGMIGIRFATYGA